MPSIKILEMPLVKDGILYREKTYFPFNIMYKLYKKTDLFTRNEVSKETRDEFTLGMVRLGVEKGRVPQEGTDYDFFKKKGTKENTVFEISKSSMKTSVVAYSSEWIQKVILSMEKDEVMDEVMDEVKEIEEIGKETKEIDEIEKETKEIEKIGKEIDEIEKEMEDDVELLENQLMEEMEMEIETKSISTQTECTKLRMLPKSRIAEYELNDDTWFSQSTMSHYYKDLFQEYSISSELFFEGMNMLNNRTDYYMEKDVDYTHTEEGELLFTKNWIRYVIIDGAKHPSALLVDE